MITNGGGGGRGKGILDIAGSVGAVIVGRGAELGAIAAVLDAARAGRGAILCLEGDAGIGKSTLLDAAAVAAADLRTLRAVGVPHELGLGHAALADVLSPLREFLDAIPAPQREALEAACGWAGMPSAGQPYLVAAATLSLLAAAAGERPVLLLVDDLHWVDRQSVAALAFALRRLDHDPVAAVVAARRMPEAFTGLPALSLTGLAEGEARELLAGVVAGSVAGLLTARTAGNPLALLEATRSLTAAQQRGSAPLPDVIPVGERLAAAFGRTVAEASPGARQALLLAAAGTRPAAGHVVAALTLDGVDAEAALAEAERSGMLLLAAGELRFRHPLLRSVVWQAATPAEQRAAHRSLAAALPADSDLAALHAAQATLGYDDEVARRLLGVAAAERRRSGYAAAGALQERAAQLTRAPEEAAAHRAAAVEDAFLAGDVPRVRTLAAEVLAAPAPGPVRARALLGLGVAEQHAGSVPRARELLGEAALTGEGEVRLRAVVELAHVGYRLGEPAAMAAAARVLAPSGPATPEQEMLAAYVRGAALAFGGDWAAAREPMRRALDLLEGEPALRDDPRHLVPALLAPGWLGDLTLVLPYLDRRMDAARAAGALGVLPLALSLIAGGAALAGRHELAYACAGEAVELGRDLGYVADVGTAHELLAWQAAARGLHDDATGALAEARRLAAIAGVGEGAVHVELVEAFAALCRGDLPRTIEILEGRLAVDEGRLPRGDYPLGVAPDLVEAYLGAARPAQAADLAARHHARHHDSPDPDVRAHAERLRAMVAPDAAVSGQAFELAHAAHAEGLNAFEAARTRLLHGAVLRRAGRRVAAREQLTAASTAFAAMGLDGWTARAEGELAGSGRTARRGPQEGDQLTSQETRVVLLVARGLSNREIAAALFLSPKTVEHHVTSALRKRGMRSRTELAVAYS